MNYRLGKLLDQTAGHGCGTKPHLEWLHWPVSKRLPPRLAAQFYGEHTATEWALIPHLRQSVRQQAKTVTRNKLSLSTEDFVVCSFGALGSAKLDHCLLDAWLASSLVNDARCRLVFVGENQNGNHGQDLLRKIAQSQAKDRISITGWVDAETYRTWLAAADVGVQLSSPALGGISDTVLDCMNYGLPVIVNDNSSMTDLPADAIWILPEVFNDEQLVEGLNHLHQDGSRRVALGARAQAYIRNHHNPRHCAEQFAVAIETNYAKAAKGLHGLRQTLSQNVKSLNPSELPRLAETLAVNFPPYPRKQQLLLDISELIRVDVGTGIQRVTRALLRNLVLNLPNDWTAEPVYALADQPGYLYARKYMCRFLGIPDDWVVDEAVQVWQGDLFLGLDLQPDVVAAQERTFRSWHRRGVKSYFIVYDLLPATMPNVFPEGARKDHQCWLQLITRFDGALCISQTVADELKDWLQTFGEKRERPFTINWFHLGADVDNSSPSRGMPSDTIDILRIFKTRPTFLMVGTIEPRKGYLQTLYAFDSLWVQGVDVNLIIVGKEGWKPLPDDQRRDIPQTVQTLRHHPELGKRLFWLNGISDEYLGQLYTHSTCLIASSFDEGFGLPIIEAARHGLPLLVRDIPVFREVADGHAYFFTNSRDPEVIANAVKEWLALFAIGEHPHNANMPHQTWKDSAKQVLSAVLGQRAPYKTWLPDGVRRYWGADPRLYTEVGEICGTMRCTTGKQGLLTYGPYVSLDAGWWRITIQGITDNWTGREWLEVCYDHGRVKLLHFMLTQITPGLWKVNQIIEIDQKCEDIDIRIMVNSESKISLIAITIEPQVEIDKSFAYAENKRG